MPRPHRCDHDHDRGNALRGGGHTAALPGTLAGEQRQQREQRNDREILEQQDGERITSVRGGEFLLLAE